MRQGDYEAGWDRRRLRERLRVRDALADGSFRTKREALGLSLNTVATLADMNPSLLSRYERAQVRPKVLSVITERLARVHLDMERIERVQREREAAS